MASLNRRQRERDLAELADGTVVDVLVIGGGVTGAGVALDAASRGLSVALVEAHDLAFGTSRWSSKLVHGGLRYLAGGDLALAYESARERAVLLGTTAPHLVRQLPMLLPLADGFPTATALAAGAGLRVADILRRAAGTPRTVLPGPRRLTAVEARHMVPALRAPGLRGGLLTWDGQLVDDARLVVAIARTAARHGARVITRCRVREADGSGATAVDTVNNSPVILRSRSVVNATGVWAGDLCADARLRPSRGTHLVVAGSALDGLRTAIIIPVPGERNRYVFALPQPGGHVYVGITDEPVDTVVDVPVPTAAELDFLLGVLSSVLTVPVGRADVLGAFAGLRPLLAGAAGRTADLSRRHAVITSSDGMVTVVGGKLTTYRRMAADTVDTLVRAGELDAGPCRTRYLPLVGAASWSQLATVAAPPRLVARYGAEAPAVVAGARGDPGLLAPLCAGVEVTGAELLFALRHEGALDADDLLDRRTRIGLVPADRQAALPTAEALVRQTLTAIDT
ncbi:MULTISPECIES: glycerol-3-phosphate dehydrogenase/oxidase [Protofrankia]|uniref:Glycerol-3-phosphate dehydrogenase n=1 Tax=Protofrankia coriariae TaxID=1562887 RepID=A0ABR5EZV3_9ACTN|nr:MULTISPECIES: glycerol-3-phosphate dehydrogenase/oxidase [Protofrankia]KLL09972.1 glycerol-3-phosphate dehydrogenase [Protofrankia coriariae]ONH33295.1 glycerol-3-phosphate dehydrogenase [Protofrankia sp. BMG5.30]